MAIESKAPDRYLINRRFEDCDEMCSALRGWDLKFTQLDRGRSPVDMLQAKSGAVSLGRARFSRHYDQKGGAPQGARTFALVEEGVRGVTWCGHEVSEETLLTFDSSGEFSAASRPGFDVYTLTFTEDLLAETTSALGLPDLSDLLDNRKQAISCLPGSMRKLRSTLREFCRGFDGDAGFTRSPEVGREMEIELPRLIANTLAERGGRREVCRHGKRTRALRQVEDYLEAHPEEALTVTGLCKLTGVSDRTLQHAFRERFGVSPKTYLQAHRLAGVRRDLLGMVSTSIRITDIANRWGFWHMGQFAADYRRMYGELPSETLQGRA